MGDLCGTFGIAIWDGHARVLHAITDPLGITRLYFKVVGNALLVSDSVRALGSDRLKLDEHFVAEFLATGRPIASRTVDQDVRALEAGTWLTWAEGRVVLHRYWDPAAFTQRAAIDDETLVTEECRSLLTRSVVAECDEDGSTWADLSGGHDSSSVCALGASLAPHVRLGGTLTFVDSLGDGDETVYVDALLHRYSLRNVRLHDWAPWTDDGLPPPVTDHPSRDYPFYARDREVSRQMRRCGAKSLLSGIGPDYYLPYSIDYCGELLGQGRVREGFRVLAEGTIARRGRFLRSAYRVLSLPMLPVCLQRRALGRGIAVPTWIRPAFISNSDFRALQTEWQVNRGGLSGYLQRQVSARLLRLGASLQHWRTHDELEVRHPLLSRRLVEFCLRLPHALRSDPQRPKRILTSALRELLPQEILTRCAKGGTILPRVCWAFGKHRRRIADLLKSSVLADAGFIEPKQMLAAVDQAAAGIAGAGAKYVYYALSLETWLAVRLGKSTAASRRETS